MTRQESLWSAAEVRTQAEQCPGQVTVWDALDETTRPALKLARAVVVAGTEWDVTNHYITREDHHCFGTHRRRITRTTGARIYYAAPSQYRNESPIDWPRAENVEMAATGTVRLYGTPKDPSALFLTLQPVAP